MRGDITVTCLQRVTPLSGGSAMRVSLLLCHAAVVAAACVFLLLEFGLIEDSVFTIVSALMVNGPVGFCVSASICVFFPLSAWRFFRQENDVRALARCVLHVLLSGCQIVWTVYVVMMI